MKDESKEEIQVILELLKGCLIKNGVSMVLKDENICFFDTDYYLRTSMFNGFKVNINDLVK